MSEKLSNWFIKRRETKTVQLMQAHLSLTTRAVEELDKAMQHKLAHQDDLAERSIERLSTMEEEADSLRKGIALELTKGEIPSNERDDLLHLSRDIDWITDWSKEAGRLLRVAPVNRLPEELTKKAVEMSHVVKQTASAVRACIDCLSKEPRDAMRLADDVEDLEEKMDVLYAETRALYPTIDFSRMNPGEFFLIGQLFDAIEEISDWCEKTIDQTRILAVRMF